MAPLTPTTSHSPYGTPVISVDFMSEATRQYYTATISASRSRTPSLIGSDEGGAATTTTTTTARTTPVPMEGSPFAQPTAPSPTGSSPRRSFVWYQHPSSTAPSGTAVAQPSYMNLATQYPPPSASASAGKTISEPGIHHTPGPVPPALLLSQQGARRLADVNYVSAFRPDWQPHRGVRLGGDHPSTGTSGHGDDAGGGALRAVAHVELMGKMTFFPYPAAIDWSSALSSTDSRVGLACLFLGQVRFEANDREVAWIVQQTTGVSPLHVEIRARGCWLVYVATAEEAARVLVVGRRILYDHSGIWFAADDAQRGTLQDYLTSPRRRSVARLPRDTVIVEPAVPGAQRRSAPHSIIPQYEPQE